MYLSELIVFGVFVASLLIVVGLLCSRSLTEHMVKRGVLPQIFLEFTPVILLLARLLAIVMILAGLGRFLAVSGVLSSEWIGRYGLASLLLAAGIVLLGISFRQRRRP